MLKNINWWTDWNQGGKITTGIFGLTFTALLFFYPAPIESEALDWVDISPNIKQTLAVQSQVKKEPKKKKIKVNINTATLKELTSVPGIGPKKAEAILDYRKEQGTFKDAQALLKVSGIGKKMLKKIKPYLEH